MAKPRRYGDMMVRQQNTKTKQLGNEKQGEITRERWGLFKRTFWQRRR